MTPKPQVVIFVLLKENKVLVEKRPVKGFSDHQYLIPGGAINPEEDLEQALKREVMEELGIVPTEFELLTEEDIIGIFDNNLKPFVITKWQGEIPKIGLDQEDAYPLEWIEIDKALNIPIESTKKIIEALKNHLGQNRNGNQS